MLNAQQGAQTWGAGRLVLERPVGRAAAATARRHLVAVAARSILRCARRAGVPLHAAARLLGARVPLVHLPVCHCGLQCDHTPDRRELEAARGAGRALGSRAEEALRLHTAEIRDQELSEVREAQACV